MRNNCSTSIIEAEVDDKEQKKQKKNKQHAINRISKDDSCNGQKNFGRHHTTQITIGWYARKDLREVGDVHEHRSQLKIT